MGFRRLVMIHRLSMIRDPTPICVLLGPNKAGAALESKAVARDQATALAALAVTCADIKSSATALPQASMKTS